MAESGQGGPRSGGSADDDVDSYIDIRNGVDGNIDDHNGVGSGNRLSSFQLQLQLQLQPIISHPTTAPVRRTTTNQPHLPPPRRPPPRMAAPRPEAAWPSASPTASQLASEQALLDDATTTAPDDDYGDDEAPLRQRLLNIPARRF